VRSYRFPVLFVARWLITAALEQRRNVGADGAEMLARLQAPVLIEGAEHIPPSGAFIVAMNHYERPGLRVWWPAIIISRAVWERRLESPPLVWLITDRFYRFRLFGLRVPQAVVSWFLGRVARTYDLLLVARLEQRAWARAIALRRAGRMLHGPRPWPVASTPEGEMSSGPRLARAIPNSGAALAWLSRGRIPIVPAAVFEDGEGRTVARFGKPFVLEWPHAREGLRHARARRDELTTEVMCEIAALLPEALRGEYGALPAEGPD
jgi:hypothetical protein